MVRRWNFQGCFQTFCAALIHSLLCKIRGHETAFWCIRPHAPKKKGLQAGIKKQMLILNVNLYFSEINNNDIEKGTRITSYNIKQMLILTVNPYFSEINYNNIFINYVCF